MKVLLTGANGQLGRCVQDVFAKTDYKLIAFDRNGLDITDADAVNAVVQQHQPDVILNAAAYTAVDKAESEPELAHEVNCVAPGLLAKAADSVGASIIHISTDYVFDGKGSRPYKESDPVCPQGIYGQTKLDGEYSVQKGCSSHVILRTAWVFSEYGNNFLKTMLRLGNERGELGVVSDQIGCPTYAGDIAKACLSICESEKAGSANYGTYHFAGDEAVSWHGFAEAIFAQVVKTGVLKNAPKVNRISTEQYPTPAKRPAYSVLSTDRITADYGVHASNWRNALERSFR